MDKKEIIQYLDQFMDYSSYLLWGDTVDDIAPITDEAKLIENFNNKYVFVAFNRSGSTKKYENFHNRHSAGDSKLMKTIKEKSEFKGSFITDVFPNDDCITPKASDLKKFFAKEPKLEKKYFSEFITRINPLIMNGAIVIAVGEECFKYLSKYKCRCLNNKLYKIPHFSSSKSYIERYKALDKILEKIK